MNLNNYQQDENILYSNKAGQEIDFGQNNEEIGHKTDNEIFIESHSKSDELLKIQKIFFRNFDKRAKNMNKLQMNQIMEED